MPIAVPWSCKRYLLSKAQVLFLNIKSIDSKIKGMLSLWWISSFYFNKKYLTASIPKVCGIFVYRPSTSKLAITVFPSLFVPYLLRKSIMSIMYLFTCFRKCFNKASIKSLTFLVGHLGLPTICLIFTSCGSLILTTSEFCSLMALVISGDLCILSSSEKLLVL